jgi:hypothetical protein
MVNSHFFKVLIGFCGMILLGLISLVIIDSLKQKDQGVVQNQQIQKQGTLPPISNQAKTPIKNTSIQNSPQKSVR